MNAIENHVMISATPVVIEEIVDVFAHISYHEAGLTTQEVKNRIYVQPSARSGWVQYMEAIPRDSEAPFPIYDIMDGSYLVDDIEPYSKLI
jgi:hypothetical protein